MLNAKLLQLDWKNVATRIKTVLSGLLTESEAKGYVIGLSGGLDSSTVAALAAQAAERTKVMGLILPDRQVTPRSDIQDAERLAKTLGIRTFFVDIAEILTVFSEASPFFQRKATIANGNLRARIRMSLLYYYANLENAIVLGTGDRSEILIGYFTKYGDGATDLLPLGDLYKTQVRGLARFMKVPTSIVSKPSSPRLWAGHTAHKELGLTYEVIDLILHGFFDLKLSREEISSDLSLPISTVTQLLHRNQLSEHKRNPPSIIRVRNQN